MNTRKSLAKVFGPVLLLTGALALPMDLSAAPQHDRGAAQEKAQKNDRQKNRQKAKKQKANQQRRQAGAQRQKAQPQKQVNRQRQANRQKATRQQAVRQQQAPRAKAKQKAVRQQQSVRRQEARKQVVHQQAVRQNQIERQNRIERQRQVELQRQATLQRQARAQRQAQLQRQAELQRQNRNRRQATQRRQAIQHRRQVRVYDNRNDYRYNGYRSGGGGGADRSIFHIDGHLTGGRDCMLVRDHDGRTWALVGDTYGLQGGEHVRLYGRIVDGGACGYEGTAFDVYEVRTVWADQNHKRTYYDHLYDGPYTRSTTYEDEYYDDAGYYEDDAYYEDDRQEQGGLLDSLLGAIRPPA